MSSRFLEALGHTRLYPITDRGLSNRSLAEQVEVLSNAGARVIQLREKRLSPSDFYREARGAITIAKERGVKIIINDRADLALALEADGVHLGQDDLPPEAARSLLGPNAIIGFSTHNLEQAALTAKLRIDYLAIGPVFSTSTKENPDPVVGLEVVAAVKRVVSVPLVAIGGITAANAASAFEAGADCVSIISDLWRTDQPSFAHLKPLF